MALIRGTVKVILPVDLKVKLPEGLMEKLLVCFKVKQFKAQVEVIARHANEYLV